MDLISVRAFLTFSLARFLETKSTVQRSKVTDNDGAENSRLLQLSWEEEKARFYFLLTGSQTVLYGLVCLTSSNWRQPRCGQMLA